MTMRWHIVAVTLALALPPISAKAQVPKAAIDGQVTAPYAAVEALYKDIHANPELAVEEVNTAKKLANELRSLGFEVTEGVGKIGVVGAFRNGDGPTVLVRTELDALPMEEKMKEGISRTAKAVAAMATAPDPDVQIVSGGDAVVNGAALVARVEPVPKTAFGAENVRRLPPVTPSEDFAEYANGGPH